MQILCQVYADLEDLLMFVRENSLCGLSTCSNASNFTLFVFSLVAMETFLPSPPLPSPLYLNFFPTDLCECCFSPPYCTCARKMVENHEDGELEVCFLYLNGLNQ